MHDTKVVLNLDALNNNLEIIRALAPRAKCLAMLKANAYGHGSVVVAQALARNVDGFGVCTIDEAAKLRQAGIENKILILQGVRSVQEYQNAAELKLDCVVHNPMQVEWLLEQQIRYPETVWLKANTGMNRLGLKPDLYPRAIVRLMDAGYEPVLMSHLACADQREHALNRKQIDLFEKLTSPHVTLERSLLNSAGLVSFAKHHYDWIRPGLSLYGVSPFRHRPKALQDLKPVMNLEARIISTYSLNVGETAGYTARWHANRKTKIAIVGAGYGDGYPRDVPNGTEVLIDDKLYPTVGVVSMDAIAIDVTDAPKDISIGTVCRLWGAGVPVENIANRLNRIPYEIVTQVTSRPSREIHDEASVSSSTVAA